MGDICEDKLWYNANEDKYCVIDSGSPDHEGHYTIGQVVFTNKDGKIEKNVHLTKEQRDSEQGYKDYLMYTTFYYFDKNEYICRNSHNDNHLDAILDGEQMNWEDMNYFWYKEWEH